MKPLTQSQEIALKTRLTDILGLIKGIETLTQRMKKDHSYINAQHLQCLTDDADSIKYLVEEIEARN